MATQSLRTVAAIATDHDDPRTGVAVYAFARDRTDTSGSGGRQQHAPSPEEGGGAEEEGGESMLHFTEVFADVEAALSHLTDLEGDAMTEMFANTTYFGGMNTGAGTLANCARNVPVLSPV